MNTDEDTAGNRTPDPLRVMNESSHLQDEHGFIPESALVGLARLHGVPESHLQGVVSFFGSFRTRPPGRHRLAVCCGTACHARGASVVSDRLRDELDLEEDGTIVERAKSYQVPEIIRKLRDADAAGDDERSADGSTGR